MLRHIRFQPGRSLPGVEYLHILPMYVIPTARTPGLRRTAYLSWKPELLAGFKKHQKHTALADIVESIEELKYYRQHFIKE